MVATFICVTVFIYLTCYRQVPYSSPLERSYSFFTVLDVIDELESIAEDVQTPQEKLVDEYDGVLEELYNFGDCGHRIWIKTA